MSNEFKDVSAKLGQFQRGLSDFQKTQLNAVSGTAASINRPGNINGSISGSVSRLDNAHTGSIDVSVRMAGALENAGISTSTSAKLLSDTINRSNMYRSNIVEEHTRPPVNLSDVNIRLPSRNRKTSATEQIQRKKETLLGKQDLNYNGEQFPNDLEQIAGNTAFLQLKFEKYERGGAFFAGAMKEGEYIYLPLPENYNQFFSVKYDQRDTGLFGEALKRVPQSVKDDIGKGDIAAAATGIINKTKDTSIRDATQVAIEVAQRKLLAELDSADDAVGGLAGSLAGAVPNPHPTVFFKGLNLRQFTWTWKLVPRSKSDSKQLSKILDIIKQNILPKTDGALLTYPSMVTPIIQGGEAAKKLGKFKRCMVSQMTVNYAGEGTSAFYNDGQAVSVILTMEFTEIENYTEEDVK